MTLTTQHEQVHWTDEARALVHPMPGTGRLEEVDAALWRAIHQGFLPYEGAFLRGADQNDDLGRHLRAACQVLASLAQGSFPDHAGGPDLDVHANAALLLVLYKQARCSYDGKGFGPEATEALLATWARHLGAAFAMRAFLASADWVLEPDHQSVTSSGPDPRASYCNSVVIPLKPTSPYNRCRDHRPWQALRRVLARVDPEGRNAAREIARARRQQLLAACASNPSGRWDDDRGSAVAERVLLSYVFPEEQAWSREDLPLALEVPYWAWAQVATPLLASLQDAEGIADLVQRLAPNMDLVLPALPYLATMVHNLGPAADRPLVTLLEHAQGKDYRQGVTSILALIGTPLAASAMAACLDDPHCRPTAARYFLGLPGLGVTTLLPLHVQGRGDLATTLLARICQTAPDAARSARPDVDPRHISALDALCGAREEASPAELPPILAQPPWGKGQRANKTPKASPACHLAVPAEDPAEVHELWEPGERDTVLNVSHRQWLIHWYREQGTLPDEEDFPADGTDLNLGRLFLLPDDAAARRIVETVPLSAWQPPQAGRPLLPYAAAFGTAFLPLLLAWAPRFLGECASALLHYDSPLVAPHLALVLRRFRQVRVGDAFGMPRMVPARPLVHRWLLDHASAAASGLVPVAVGPPGDERDACAETLRFLASAGHAETVRGTARRCGAVEAVDEILAFDPMKEFPAKLPRLPAFYDPAGLPPPRLAKSGRALPVDAVGHLGTMLAFSPLLPPYPGLTQVREACTPESLDAFAWALFQTWMLEGAPPKEQWCFVALGHLGSDAMAARLAPYLRAWPREGAQARAALGLDVLALIGSDVALRILYGIAEHGRKTLAQKARERMNEVAQMRGLSAEELADRLVPDFDLEEDGSCMLDFGPRKFRVGFDEQLAPCVVALSREGGGKRLKELPTPAVDDDKELAALAAEQWKLLKKGVKKVMTEQVHRLELALATERRWQIREFRDTLLHHPLLVHLVRRLVWGAFDEEDRLVAAFHPREDSTLETADGCAFTLPSSEGVRVGLVHPLNLPQDEVRAWSSRLAERGVVPLFPQLGRPVHRPTDEEREEEALRRVEGRQTQTARLLGLERRGWRKGPTSRRKHSAQQVCVSYEKSVANGTCLVTLSFRPGFDLGSNDGTQQLGEVRFMAPAGRRHGPGFRLGDLSPVTFSEVVADLETLKASRP